MVAKTLNNGLKMPFVGLGTWQSKPNEVKEAVKHALSVGYRHIDGAWIYGNESEIGEALQQSWSDSLTRNDVFLTSKLWCNKHHPEDVRPAIEDSLQKLQVDYLDLYLVHWPMDFQRGEESFPIVDGKLIAADPPISIEDTWKAMEELVDAGLTKSIGVSNYTVEQLERILKVARITPAVLQIELHPYLQQKALVDLCKKHNIAVTAYSPLGSPARPNAAEGEPAPLADSLITELADKYGKTPAQILIRWEVDVGNIVIPKSVTKARIEENFNVFDFELSSEDLERISSLDQNWRAVVFNITDTHPSYPFH